MSIYNWGSILAFGLLLIIGPNSRVWSQTNSSIDNIKFDHLTEGLSQTTVTCMLQDSRGFMWFGTRNGLNRYDGVEFTIYENSEEDSASLSHSYVTYMLEDSKGNLWVGTLEGGLNLYNRESDTFSHFYHNKNKPYSLSSNSVTCLFEDKNQQLWVGTEYGLNLFLPENKDFVHFKNDISDPTSLSDNNIGVIFEDNKFNLWVGTKGGGLEFFDQENKKFVHHRFNESDERSISSNVLRTYYKDSQGRVWLGTPNGLNLLVENKNGVDFTRYQHQKNNPNSLGSNSIISISQDLSGRLWIGTQVGGLSIYDVKQNVFTNLYPDPLDPYSISSNSIWSIFRDHDGTMWIGARNRGLDNWNQHQQNFNHISIKPSGNYTLSNKDVTCFLEDDLGNLWIGTDGGGLSYYDRENNTYTHYNHDPTMANSLGSNSVLSLLFDSQKNLWVGTWGGGLNLFDEETSTFKRYAHNSADPTSISGNNIFTMLEDSYGKLWIGVFLGGVNLFDPNTDSFVHYNYNPNNETSISNNKITMLFEDSRRNLWIGTDGGGLNLMHWGGKNQVTFSHYKHDSHSPGSLSSNIINTITEDSNNNLWIGSWKGLNKFDYQNNSFHVYHKKDGLPDNVIHGILEDNKGLLWLSTNQGLSMFNPISENFKNYSTEDGLQSQEFIRGSYLKTKAGELLFGGVNGFNAFWPEDIKDKSFDYPLYLTEIKVDNRLIKPNQENSPLRKHISETDEIILAYDQNNFTIGFVALNFSHGSQNMYSYILEGYDKGWQDGGSQRNANYSKVPPGTYTFRVTSTHTHGNWNKAAPSLKLIITPPWWKTGWAYTLYGLSLVGVLIWYRQTLIRQLKLRSDLKLEHMELIKMQEMERLKSNFFANISHEFRTPLTLILSPLQDMYSGNIQGDLRSHFQIMIRNAKRLLRLINQLLDLSRLDSGKMTFTASKISLVDFLKPLFSSFESYAQKKRLTYSFTYPEDEEPIQVYVDRDKLEIIIINLLSNAFKFTDSGEIILSVKIVNEPEETINSTQRSSHYVEISVSDSGIGIPEDSLNYIFDHFYQVAHRVHPGDKEGSGIGLSLTKELVELHKGKIEVESIVGAGTSFKVLLPLGKEHFNEKELADRSWESSYKNLSAMDLVQLEEEEIIASTDENESREKGIPLILLVEDNDDLRTYLKTRLKGNYHVIEAVNGVEGLKMGLDKLPDLIISDILMPKMNGVDMCRSLKNNIQTSHIPIILLTAQANSENKIIGLETGADDYVSKPFDSNELEVRVKNLIKSREILRERFTQNNKLVLEPNEIAITPLDEIFLKKVLQSIEENISDPEYRVEDLGRDVAMSRMPLYRKIKALTGQTAVEFIRNIRLKRAAQLLKHQQFNVSEVTYEVGFNDLQYFRTCFKKQFGVSPSEYAKKNPEGKIQDGSNN
ncbi:two-component regulator propeller domain-containing protein [Algoriphagus resistens]|uniref:two-component regulator propeller domain-containing protein n=1 Tax=Algoriphagus resistens TaxID=1750590 RepID=UPI000716B667|nr:two-component regulator propeller domain-containing protein [Algoriphagus resistens]